MSEHIGETLGEFAVVQWFDRDTYEYVRRGCGGEEAVKAFRHYCTSVGAKLGTTIRVIIEDGGGCINAEWLRDEGITFLGSLDNPHLGKFKEGQDG